MSKIMLVEDDNNLREIYEARLQAEGYAIVSAKDGEEALVLAKNEHPDLIIADVMMPKVSGFEMLDILRNTDGLRDTKIIMLTALGQSEDQTRADKLGADRYLVKSQVTLEDIVKVAHDLLNEATGSEPAVNATEPAVATPAITVPVEVTVPAPVAPVADAVPAEDYSTPPAQATTTTDTTDTAASVIPVNLAPETSPAVAETTAEEESEVESKIKDFINSNPPADATETAVTDDAASNDADNSQTMTDAIDNLMAKPRPEPTPEPTPEPIETETKVDEVAPPEAAPIDMSIPVLITPTVPATDGNVPIAHKKIISPIDDEVTPIAPKTDINVLLAQEEAKDKALNAVPAEPQSPETAQVPALPFDPNNISL